MSDPHIVLICLDTVRKDFYDQYALQLREQATFRFEEMRAASSWSVPSHAAMVTGQLPHQMGLHAYNQDFSTLSSAETWFDKLEDYRTACISSNIYASPAFGFDTLFDKCVGISPSRRFPAGIDIDKHIRTRNEGDGMATFIREVLQHDHPLQSMANGALFKIHDICQGLPIEQPFDFGAKSIARAIRNELTQATEQTFLFANFMDAHGPHSPFRALDDDLYACPPTFTSLAFKDWEVNVASEHGAYGEEVKFVRQLYAAEIAYLDHVVSNLIETIRNQISRETIFIVTADHGENLAYPEDGYLMNHVSSLSEALLHVPFDIYSSNHAGEVEDLASHLDLGKIVSRLSVGDSVSDVTRETPAAEIAGSGSSLPDTDQSYWDRAQRAIYQNGRKYIQDNLGESIVYDVTGPTSTQEELPNVTAPNALFERVFDDTIEEFAQRAEDQTVDVEVDVSTENRLKELGYL